MCQGSVGTCLKTVIYLFVFTVIDMISLKILILQGFIFSYSIYISKLKLSTIKLRDVFKIKPCILLLNEKKYIYVN